MKPVREVVSREIIDDLWGAGYTILPRARHPDPFHMPAEMVPQGRAYQWMHLINDKVYFTDMSGCYSRGWAPVPSDRHDGYFMPAGYEGAIEVNGLGLFEKPKFEVDAELADQVAKAKQQVTDWAEKNKDLFGDVTVNGDRFEIGTTKTFEDVTKIPRELTPYIAQIFEERDRISRIASNAMDDNTRPREVRGILDEFSARIALVPDAPKWPTLNAIILPTAIANIRKRITEEATSGQAS